MATSNVIHTDCIRLRNKSDLSPLPGVTVALLPEGGTAPGDLISLTQNAGLTHQYDFSSAVVDGAYLLYVAGVPVVLNGQAVEVHVIRGANVTTPGGGSSGSAFTHELLNQSISTELSEETIDITSLGFSTAPKAFLFQKSGWGAYITNVPSAYEVEISLNSYGVGPYATFDLFFISQD